MLTNGFLVYLTVQLTGSPMFLSNTFLGLARDRYFSRMWTTQEVAMAVNCRVCFGGLSMPWADFTKALLRLGLPPHSDGFVAFRLLRSNREDQNQSNDKDHAFQLLSLTLLLSIDRVATDPRDKVFALYSIFREYNISIPAPDYSKSISVVYTEAVAAIIKGSQSLLVLSMVNNNKREPGLPSWVPDWSDPGFGAPVLGPRRFTFSNARLPVPSEKNGLLRVYGVVFGRIVSLSDSFRESQVLHLTTMKANAVDVVANDSLKHVQVLQNWTRTARQISSYPTGESVLVAYLMAITEGWVKPVDTGHQNPQYTYETFSSWCNILAQDDEAVIPQGRKLDENVKIPGYREDHYTHPAYPALEKLHASQQLGPGRNVWKMHQSLTSIAENRALFITDNGYMGVAFHNMQEGDIIVLLSHAGVPYIIRPSNASCYRLVAPAFIHGVMGLPSGSMSRMSAEELQEFVLQ